MDTAALRRSLLLASGLLRPAQPNEPAPAAPPRPRPEAVKPGAAMAAPAPRRGGAAERAGRGLRRG